MKYSIFLSLLSLHVSVSSAWVDRRATATATTLHTRTVRGRNNYKSVYNSYASTTTTTTATTTSTSLHAAAHSDWEEGYQQFLAFIEREGHSNVSLSCQELGAWVRNQRLHYKQYREGKATLLTSEQLKLLQAANFAFEFDEERWLGNYRELVQFKKEHGHCRVPLTFTSPLGTNLGLWVSQQRMQYKKRQQSNATTGSLTEERIQMLQEQDFIWDVSEWIFEQNLMELKDFTAAGGQLYELKSTDEPLGKWMAGVKKEYRKYLSNQTHGLSDHRLNCLIDVGFSPQLFQITHTKVGVVVDWDSRMEELTAFYQEHGHTAVPRGGAGSLGHWVRKVRERMVEYHKDGTDCPIKQARLKDLESVNFIWDVQEYKWNRQYDRLLEYRREMGHCNVPSAHSDLGLWVKTQRKEYAKLCEGEKSQLSLRRVQLLEQAGFEWSRAPVVESRNEALFQKRLEEFVEWNSAKEDSTPSDSLMDWMERQRKLYRKWLQGDAKALKEGRRAALEEIGLVQDIRSMEPQLIDGNSYDGD